MPSGHGKTRASLGPNLVRRSSVCPPAASQIFRSIPCLVGSFFREYLRFSQAKFSWTTMPQTIIHTLPFGWIHTNWESIKYTEVCQLPCYLDLPPNYDLHWFGWIQLEVQLDTKSWPSHRPPGAMQTSRASRGSRGSRRARGRFPLGPSCGEGGDDDMCRLAPSGRVE